MRHILDKIGFLRGTPSNVINNDVRQLESETIEPGSDQYVRFPLPFLLSRGIIQN
jgi:hypothetical protein